MIFQGTKGVRILFYTNVIVFALSSILQLIGVPIIENLALFNYNTEYFHTYQIITHQFLHGGVIHILFNMLVLISLAPQVEEYLDTKKFIIYYLICGVFAGLFHSFMVGGNIPMVGASGSIYGIVSMFALIYPNTKLSLMFIPIGFKAKWLIGIMMLIELILGIYGPSDGIGHFAHLGGGIMGLCLFIYERYVFKNPN